MQFYEMHICQVIIFTIYTAYVIHRMIKKMTIKTEKIASIIASHGIILSRKTDHQKRS